MLSLIINSDFPSLSFSQRSDSAYMGVSGGARKHFKSMVDAVNHFNRALAAKEVRVKEKRL